MNPDKALLRTKKYSLSDQDISVITGNTAHIVSYPELPNYESIDQLLGRKGAAIILFVNKGRNYGHWVSLFKRTKPNGQQVISFFDPYGTFPDKELLKIPRNVRKINNELVPHLTYLLFFAPHHYEIEYSPFKLQEWKKDVNTCGRHAGMRVHPAFRNLSPDEYAHLLMDGKFTPDEFVTLFTSYV